MEHAANFQSENNTTTLPAPPPELAEIADLSGLPRVQVPPELRSSEEARRATPEIRDIAAALFEATCRAGYKPGSFCNDLDEIAFAARTTRRRLKHRWSAVAELLHLYQCADGRLWSELAIPICLDAWRRRLASRAAVRARLRPSSARRPGAPVPPQRGRSRSEWTPFESHFAQETEDFCGGVAHQGKAQAREHTPSNESVAEAAELRSVCVDCVYEGGTPARPQPAEQPLPETGAAIAEPDQVPEMSRRAETFAEPEPALLAGKPPIGTAAEPEAKRRRCFDELAGLWPNKAMIEAAWREYRRLKADDGSVIDAAKGYLAAQERRFGQQYDPAKTPQLRYWLRDGGHLDEEAAAADEYEAAAAGEYEEWRWRLKLLIDGGSWLDSYGALPGEAGCGVPEKVLKRPEFAGWPEGVALHKAKEKRHREAMDELFAKAEAERVRIAPAPPPRRARAPLPSRPSWLPTEETPEELAEFERAKAALLAEFWPELSP